MEEGFVMAADRVFVSIAKVKRGCLSLRAKGQIAGKGRNFSLWSK
jgi:hypothetical protein